MRLHPFVTFLTATFLLVSAGCADSRNRRIASSDTATPSVSEIRDWRSRQELGLNQILDLQSTDGSFQALATPTSASYNADLILLYEFIGVLEQKQAIVTPLLTQIWSMVNPDGGFPAYPGGPSNSDVSISAYLATRVTGEHETTARMVSLAKWIHENGGLKGAKTARIYLMIFGIDTTGNCMIGGVESLMLLIKNQLPVVLRDMLVPVIHILASGNAHVLPDDKAPVALGHSGMCGNLHVPKWTKSAKWTERHFYRWLDNAINPDGTLFEYTPITIVGLMALSKSSLSIHQDMLKTGIKTLETQYLRTMPNGLQVALADGSIAETSFTLQSLVDSGSLHDLQRQAHSAESFLYKSRTPEKSAWGFSRNNTKHPDSDDSSFTLRALKEFSEATHEPAGSNSVTQIQALRWILSMQNRDGGFATYDKKNPPLISKLTGGTSGGAQGFSMTGSTTETTSRTALLLRSYLNNTEERENLKTPYKKAIQWLLKTQNPDGSYSSVWFVNYIFGTASTLAALGGASTLTEFATPELKDAIENSLKFILEKQASDGGFSESPESFSLNHYVSLEKSSPAQTGLVLIELLTFLREENYRHWNVLEPVLNRAVRFLIDNQKSDGLWHDTTITATIFPGYEYLIYPIIQELAPVNALGFYLQTLEKFQK